MKLHPSLKILLLVLVILLELLYPNTAAARQNTVVLDGLRVDIWPEYDQPSVLVIYHLTLSPQVSLPATLNIRIPAEVGQPHAVAMQDVAGLYNLNYEINAAGEWVEVTFTTPVPEVRIEYYDPTLQKNGSTRNYIFRWPGDYTVENLSVSIQQPVNATNMTFRPSLGSGSQGEDGLTYYNLAAGKVNEGTTFEIAVSYDKPDDTLTNTQQFLPAQPKQPVDSNTSGRVTLELPWALGGVGILLIAAGLLWYWRTGRTPAPVSGPRKSHPRRSAAPVQRVSAGSDAEETNFCQQCGKRAAPGDVFCRACGTKLQ